MRKISFVTEREENGVLHVDVQFSGEVRITLNGKRITDVTVDLEDALFADVDLDLCKTREESGIDLGTIRLENKL